MDDLVASAVRLVSNRVGNHTLKMETPEDILLVSVDGRLFIQVLVNLLDNAFRHSGTGTTVTLRVKQDGNCLKFVVSDNGIGIPNDKIDKIFDNSLPLLMRTGISSGAWAWGLPYARPWWRPRAAPSGPSTAPRGELYLKYQCQWRTGRMNETTILVIEDDKSIQNFMKISLKTRGYAYILADNGLSGISLFTRIIRT